VSQNIEVMRSSEGGMLRHDLNGASERSHGAQVALHDGIDTLNRLAAQLAAAVETLEEPAVPTIENGLDFYEEVRKFEISLIQRALKMAGGVQNRAAIILNLKHTTLNTKIKQYKLG
jgi:transcriptional regulator with PAS, ATPase and Fis domain